MAKHCPITWHTLLSNHITHLNTSSNHAACLKHIVQSHDTSQCIVQSHGSSQHIVQSRGVSQMHRPITRRVSVSGVVGVVNKLNVCEWKSAPLTSDQLALKCSTWVHRGNQHNLPHLIQNTH